MSENNNQHVLKSELSNAKTEPIKILLRAIKTKSQKLSSTIMLGERFFQLSVD